MELLGHSALEHLARQVATRTVTQRAGNDNRLEGEFNAAGWNVLAANLALYDEYLSGT